MKKIIKYFVYKGTGGLFHNLCGLSKAIELSIKDDVTLIIDMDNHPGFMANFNDFFTIKCKKLKYSCNYESLSFKHIKLKSVNEYIKRTGIWSNYKIDYNKKVNVLFGYYDTFIYNKIQVQPLYFDKIQSQNQIIKNNYISIHFRNSDKKNDINIFFNKIINVLDKYRNINTIYIASDDYDFYNEVEKKFSKINIIRKTFFEPGLKNLHYGVIDKKKQMYDCLVDIYYILLSDVFIPSLNSTMSKCIINMIKNNYYIFPNILSKTIIEW